jgi:hypothetical protein
MTDLYLIAHKVRGERGYDVACKMEMPDGTWWIIPTSGHRAYPFWHTYLGEPDTSPMPPDIQDHYATNAPPRPSRSESPLARERAPVPRLEDL